MTLSSGPTVCAQLGPPDGGTRLLPQMQPSSPWARGCRLSSHGAGSSSATTPQAPELPGGRGPASTRPQPASPLISHTCERSCGPPGRRKSSALHRPRGTGLIQNSWEGAPLGGGGLFSHSWGAGLGAPCLKRGQAGAVLQGPSTSKLAPSHRGYPLGGPVLASLGEHPHLRAGTICPEQL